MDHCVQQCQQREHKNKVHSKRSMDGEEERWKKEENEQDAVRENQTISKNQAILCNPNVKNHNKRGGQHPNPCY